MVAEADKVQEEMVHAEVLVFVLITMVKMVVLVVLADKGEQEVWVVLEQVVLLLFIEIIPIQEQCLPMWH